MCRLAPRLAPILRHGLLWMRAEVIRPIEREFAMVDDLEAALRAVPARSDFTVAVVEHLHRLVSHRQGVDPAPAAASGPAAAA